MLYSNGFELWHHFSRDTLLTESPISKMRETLLQAPIPGGEHKALQKFKDPSFKHWASVVWVYPMYRPTHARVLS